MADDESIKYSPGESTVIRSYTENRFPVRLKVPAGTNADTIVEIPG